MKIALVALVAVTLGTAAPNARTPAPFVTPALIAGEACANICDWCWANEWRSMQNFTMPDPWDWKNNNECRPLGEECELCVSPMAQADGLSDDDVLKTIRLALADGSSSETHSWAETLGDRLLLNHAQGTIAVKGGCSGDRVIALVRASTDLMAQLELQGVMALGAYPTRGEVAQ